MSARDAAGVILSRMHLARWANHLLDFCYPGVCAGCETSCEGSAALCEACEEELEQLESAPACPYCAAPVAQAGGPCQFCNGKGVPHYERIARLGIYDGPIKQIIHQIKYHNRWPLARFLARRLLRHEPVRDVLAAADCVVAVPLHPLRQIARGYNQAELIARKVARRTGLKLAHPIIRLRNTPTQTYLHSRTRREENLRDAFGLWKPKSIRGKRVAIVDDVMTTGATLHAAAQALVEAEPKSLCAIVVAVADPRHQDFQKV